MPADPHRAVLLRRIVAVDGPARVTVTLDVRGGYGRRRMAGLSREGTSRTGCWSGRSGATLVPLVGGVPGPARRRRGCGCVALAPATTHDLVLELSDRDLDRRAARPGRDLVGDRGSVVGRLPGCDDLIAVADSRHAYAVLRGLTSASGGMVAAATTSMPERLRGGRNYDYRYAWIRDQCYAGIAVAAHGPHPLLTGTLRFVTARLLDDGPELMPA